MIFNGVAAFCCCEQLPFACAFTRKKHAFDEAAAANNAGFGFKTYIQREPSMKSQRSAANNVRHRNKQHQGMIAFNEVAVLCYEQRHPLGAVLKQRFSATVARRKRPKYWAILTKRIDSSCVTVTT